MGINLSKNKSMCTENNYPKQEIKIRHSAYEQNNSEPDMTMINIFGTLGIISGAIGLPLYVLLCVDPLDTGDDLALGAVLGGVGGFLGGMFIGAIAQPIYDYLKKPKDKYTDNKEMLIPIIEMEPQVVNTVSMAQIVPMPAKFKIN